ncbi:tetratricopeptide repeat protein, partial [Oribacterium sinus]
MDFSGYEKEIQDLSLLIEKQYTLFDEGIFHSLGYLLGMAEKLDDESLKGYVYYQLADAYYSFHFDVDQMQLYLSKAIKSQQEVQDFSLLTRSHNLLGITEFLRGNFALALDYYMTALKYYEQMEEADNSLSGIVKSNIARLYFSLNDYDHGRYYAEEALYDISGTTVDSAYV